MVSVIETLTATYICLLRSVAAQTRIYALSAVPGPWAKGIVGACQGRETSSGNGAGAQYYNRYAIRETGKPDCRDTSTAAGLVGD